MTKQFIFNLIKENIREKLPKVKKSEHADIEEALLEAIFIPYQVIEIDCPQDFIDENFDLTPGETMGLGINLMEGLAMCNGNNGTQDRRRRVSVQYDPTAFVSGHNYSVMGNTGGSENAVVVLHDHPITNVGNVNNGQTGGEIANHTARWDSGSGTFLHGTVEAVGESGAGKNMQPFIVTLMLQRIMPLT